MKKLFIYYCLTLFAVYGCSDDSGNLAVPDEPSFDDLVYQNCLAAQAAAEAYAAVYGDYPYFTCLGLGYLSEGLDDFLPDSTALTNPRTGLRTDPVMFEPTGIGSVSYRVFSEYDADMEWRIVGYYIRGTGLYQDFVITNIDDPAIHIQRKQTVVDNVLTLIDALNKYISANEGVYPVDQYEENYRHNSLLEYFPDQQLLLNPYTNEWTEPSIWTRQDPQSPGQISYAVWDADGNGTPDGCRIMAVASYPPYTIVHHYRGHWIDEGFYAREASGAHVCTPGS